MVILRIRIIQHVSPTILLCATGDQWSKAGHEKVKPWKWNHVDGEFAKVSIQLNTFYRDAYNVVTHKS